jgi:predicted amino acid-binding ACT domain protein
MAKELAIITVMGRDRTGSIAAFSQVLAKHKVNIEDLEQKVYEGTFVMMMMVDVAGASCDVGALRKRLERVGRRLEMGVHLQHASIFKAMHRI